MIRRILAAFFTGFLAVTFYITSYFTTIRFLRFQDARREYAILSRARESRINPEEYLRLLLQAAGELDALRYLALYNLGNLKFREALRKKELLLLLAARDYYRRALQNKSDFLAAKRNLEIVESLIKKVEEEIERQKDSVQRDDIDTFRSRKPSFIPFTPRKP